MFAATFLGIGYFYAATKYNTHNSNNRETACWLKSHGVIISFIVNLKGKSKAHEQKQLTRRINKYTNDKWPKVYLLLSKDLSGGSNRSSVVCSVSCKTRRHQAAINGHSVDQIVVLASNLFKNVPPTLLLDVCDRSLMISDLGYWLVEFLDRVRPTSNKLNRDRF